MEKEVVIHMKRSQSSEGQTHTEEMKTQGTLCLNEDGYTLRYREWGLINYPGSKMIEVGPGAVCMNLMEPGHIALMIPRHGRAVNHIATPNGLIALDVQMRQMHSAVNEQGGELDMTFELRNGGYSITHSLQLTMQ